MLDERQPLLEVVVTTCCDRDITWLGELFSYAGWTVGRKRAQSMQNISLPAILGAHAHLKIYDKGGNESSIRRLLRQVRNGGIAHSASMSVVPLPLSTRRLFAGQCSRWSSGSSRRAPLALA